LHTIAGIPSGRLRFSRPLAPEAPGAACKTASGELLFFAVPQIKTRWPSLDRHHLHREVFMGLTDLHHVHIFSGIQTGSYLFDCGKNLRPTHFPPFNVLQRRFIMIEAQSYLAKLQQDIRDIHDDIGYFATPLNEIHTLLGDIDSLLHEP
jgi:hypothetical protein